MNDSYSDKELWNNDRSQYDCIQDAARARQPSKDPAKSKKKNHSKANVGPEAKYVNKANVELRRETEVA